MDKKSLKTSDSYLCFLPRTILLLGTTRSIHIVGISVQVTGCLELSKTTRSIYFSRSCPAKVSHIQPVKDSLLYQTSRERSSYFWELPCSEQRNENGIFHSRLIPGPNWLLISVSLSIKERFLHARTGGRPDGLP